MRSVANASVHVVFKCSQKVHCANVGRPGLLCPIPIIQDPFNSSWGAQQNESQSARRDRVFHTFS